MDPSTKINSVTDNTTAFQRAPSGLPPPGASKQQAIPGALCIAGIPVISLPFLVAERHPLFAPFGINVDRLLEPTQEARDEVEDRFKCPICLGAYVQPTAIKVYGHVFWASCTARALKNPKKCPLCRTKATKRHLLQMYLS